MSGIIKNILAVIGVLFLLLCIAIFMAKPYYDVTFKKSRYALTKEKIRLLRSSGSYLKDTTDFKITIIHDSIRAKEIKEYFQLDTLYPPDSDSWTKALAIAKFVALNIPHANQKEWPENIDAIGLWEYTKNVAPAFNCRLHSILSFELFLSAGLDAKYTTCMPEENDNDCHVVNEVWIPELGKWAMIDTDMGGHYFADKKDVPLSLKEIREHYISGKRMTIHPLFEKGSSNPDWYRLYMAKNTYWFSSWGGLSYYQEDYDMEDIIGNHYIILVPSGYKPFISNDGDIITTDADRFWDVPTK